MSQLQLTIGQYTSKGRKEVNQDFHDIRIPSEPLISSKGVAVAMADGISSSKVSQEASKISVNSFLEDYFSTSEAWSVKKSAQRVIQATNSWIYAQNRQNLYHLDKDRGFVCTFSAMVVKSTTAYIFHIGDIRIYRLRDGVLEQLTEDHRTWISKEKSYLARALGIDTNVRIDYETLDVKEGDIFLFMTDGVYEFTDYDWMIERLCKDDTTFDEKAEEIVRKAYDEGSDDNLTMQIVRVETLPEKNADEIQLNLPQKQLPPILEARMEFDGYTIIRELSKSSRSHVYLASDNDTGQSAVIKIPSTEHKEDKAYLERFLLEEWIARRINNQHVLKAYPQDRERNYLYTVMEYVEGQTLEQWMIDNPNPSLEEVRNITDQVSRGLLAFHRQEMIHQDLRPANIMIDKTGSVKIIDLGAVRVAGISEINTLMDNGEILGTMTYSAPEYFLGDAGTYRSDIFSLGVIVYQMLSGKLPYGLDVAKANTKSAQRKLKYHSLYTEKSDIPLWIDETLRKVVEDEAVIRNNIASMLRYFFKDVFTANDGYDGLEKYEKHLPDIIMTDLKMPFMGGFELLDELKKRSSNCYRIVVSAHTDTELLINAVNNGIDRYIIKPVTERQLFDALEAYIDKLEHQTQDLKMLFPGIMFDIDKRELSVKDKRVHLNNKETLLLKLLIQDKNKTYSYEEIENQVWGEKSMSLTSLRSIVRDIRKKTGEQIIKNVSGIGYRLNYKES